MGDVEVYRPRNTTDRATWAGICAVLLSRSGYTPHDQRAANRLVAACPPEFRDLPHRIARIARLFQVRSLHRAVADGIKQFLVIGCGGPCVLGNPHENVPSDARVVLVDVEQAPVNEYKSLVARNDNVLVIHADMREPDTILEHPEIGHYIDFTEPTWLGMIEVLSCLQLNPPDSIYDLVRQYTDALAPGSQVAVSVDCPADVPPEVRSALNAFNEIYRDEVGQPRRLFTMPHIDRLLEDTEKLQPITYVSDCLLNEPTDRYISLIDPAKTVGRGAVGRIPA